MGRLDSIQQKQLKGPRFIFLKNNEDIPENARNILRNLRGNFLELGDTYIFKEALRTIYCVVQNAYQANIALHRWCKLAEETLVPELKTMAKTIRDRLDGIVSYWTFGHAKDMCSGETFRFRLNGRLNVLRGRGEQPFVLDQRHGGIEHQEERCHHDEGKHNGQKHDFELLN